MTWPEYLDKLATTALLGTELSDPPGQPPLPGFEAWTHRLAIAGKEGQFLGLAAAAFLYDRAARQAERAPGAKQAAPAETLPLIGQAAQDRIHAMVSGQHPEILGEFLQRVAENRLRLPPQFLPALFTRAMKENELWPALTQVMGERGHWLAAQNPDWKLDAKAPAESIFQTGSREERLACLRQIRLADPDRSRTLLQASWAEEKPEDRAAFLEILLLKISLEDEPFLQQALVDKRKEVREIALEGLAQLPLSGLAQRMQTRLSDLVKVIKPFLGRAKLNIEIPEQMPADWQKDGIDAKSKVQGLGDKAYRLYCLVGATPLSFWSGLKSWTPDESVEAIYQTDWHDAILLGLAKAAIRQQNRTCGQAVLSFWALQPKSLEYAARRAMAQNLLESFDASHREAFLIGWMERQRRLHEGEIPPYFAFFLNLMTHSWSLNFTEKVLSFLSGPRPIPKRQFMFMASTGRNWGGSHRPSFSSRRNRCWQSSTIRGNPPGNHFLPTSDFAKPCLRRSPSERVARRSASTRRSSVRAGIARTGQG